MDDYTDLEQKKEFMICEQPVKTAAEFDAVIADLTEQAKDRTQRYCFRGVNEARYKMFTSLQIDWAKKGMSQSGLTPRQFVQNELAQIKNHSGKALCRYFNQLGVKVNDWLLLAFLQHYESPSPLIDFSHDLETAIFFMLKDMQTASDMEGINGYMQLVYYIGKDVCRDSVSMLLTKYAERASENLDFSNQKKHEAFKANQMSFQQVMNYTPTIIIPSYKNTYTLKFGPNDKVTHIKFPISNMNMVCQKAEFVCFVDEQKPLEQLWTHETSRLHCINIHKNLYEYILQKYLNLGTIEEANAKYFPVNKNIASAIYKFALGAGRSYHSN